MSDVSRLTVSGGVATLTINAPPVNALSAAVRQAIADGIAAAVADPAVAAIVLACAGKTFIAGADIAEFGRPPAGPPISTVIDAIDGAAKPVVAAIHGTALGGGLEVAMACHYRVAADTATLGMPEVRLGLIPGAGGTQRLPRLVGVAKALDMIVSGAPIGAGEALAAGLVDEVVPAADLITRAQAFAAPIADRRPLPRARDRSVEGAAEAVAAFAETNAAKLHGRDAPQAALAVIEATAGGDFDAGVAAERAAFERLLAGPQSRALRYLFQAERTVWKVPDVPADTPLLAVERVGVVGAGLMGGGIAMSFANVGLPVTIVETTQEALDRGLATIRRNYEGSVKRGRIVADEAGRRVARIAGTLDLTALADCDLVVEAVFEDMAVKTDLFRRLDAIAKPGAILASNTSALDLDQIAAATGRPEAVIGLHFFSPAHVMRLLEVVRGARTAPDVIATAMATAKRIGKVAALVGVCRGFVGNRMLDVRQREARALVAAGVMPWRIDRLMTEFGFPMGPFALTDLIGLQLFARGATPPSLIDRLVAAGRLGQKTGAGWYDYDDARRPRPSPVVEAMVRETATSDAAAGLSDEAIVDRLLLPVINEGVRVLAEGMAIRASDIDVIWVNGYGWPTTRGGPMFHADEIGLDRVVEGLRRLEREHGAAFAPAPLLVETAAAGGRLHRLSSTSRIATLESA